MILNGFRTALSKQLTIMSHRIRLSVRLKPDTVAKFTVDQHRYRRGLLKGAGLALLLACACQRTEPVPPTPEPRQEPPPARHRLKRETTTTALREVSVSDLTHVEPSRRSSDRPAKAAAIGSAVAVAPVSGSSAVAQQSLDKLTQIDLSHGPLTQSQAADLNQAFRQLQEQGAAAIPAIQKFLEKNEDVSFDGVQGGEQVDYGSVRLGMIDTLARIGGPEAAAAAAATLQNTADPLEIALLTRALEETAPNQYRAQELAAAQEVLAQAQTGQWKGGDMSALFETMQAVGDASIVADLKQAVNKWNYYATLALAGLPNGAGIPALIELAQNPDISSLGTGDFALRPLAQVALQYPAAASALVDQARQNQIPDAAWPTVIASLSGTYIQYGNQIFGSTAAPQSWTEPEILQRINLLNQLVGVTANPTARQSMQQTIVALSGRLPRK
jgi:hypothetical protein